jgi:hypothetical protein
VAQRRHADHRRELAGRAAAGARRSSISFGFAASRGRRSGVEPALLSSVLDSPSSNEDEVTRMEQVKLGAVLNLIGAGAVLVAAWIATADQAVRAVELVPWPLLIQHVG